MFVRLYGYYNWPNLDFRIRENDHAILRNYCLYVNNDIHKHGNKIFMKEKHFQAH